MCLNQRAIENKRYKPNKKNNGVPERAKDYRLKGVTIPCGYCAECVGNRRSEWAKRILEEQYVSGPGYFVTLTIAEDSMDELIKEAGTEEANAVARVAVRRWTERYRKEKKSGLRHWLVVELGQNRTERLHLHGIIWLSGADCKVAINKWKYGNTWSDKARGRQTAFYVTKYLNKVDKKHPGFKGRTFVSKNIGANYLATPRGRMNRYRGKDTDVRYHGIGETRKGFIGTYYRRKIYSDTQREEMRLWAMDEPKVVCGTVMREKPGTKEWAEEYKRLTEMKRRNSIADGYKYYKRKLYKCRGGIIIIYDALKYGKYNVHLPEKGDQCRSTA